MPSALPARHHLKEEFRATGATRTRSHHGQSTREQVERKGLDWTALLSYVLDRRRPAGSRFQTVVPACSPSPCLAPPGRALVDGQPKASLGAIMFHNFRVEVLVDEDAALPERIGSSKAAYCTGMTDQATLVPQVQLIARRLHLKTAGAFDSQIQRNLVGRTGAG